MQPYFPNPFMFPAPPPPLPYGNSLLLNEIHIYFPALLYDTRRFRNIHDVFSYVSTEMRRRFDTFSSAQRAYRDSLPQPVQRTTRNVAQFPSSIQIPGRTMEQVIESFITTTFGNTMGLPPGFMDPVVVTASRQQIELASTLYQAITALESPCAICQDVIAAGNLVRKLRGCNHIFHVDCIDEWFQRSAMCPQCRHDIRTPTPTAVTTEGTTSPQHTSL
jgi:hypothetical protein